MPPLDGVTEWLNAEPDMEALKGNPAGLLLGRQLPYLP